MSNMMARSIDFVNDTAANVSDPHVHLLARPDALPVCRLRTRSLRIRASDRPKTSATVALNRKPRMNGRNWIKNAEFSIASYLQVDHAAYREEADQVEDDQADKADDEHAVLRDVQIKGRIDQEQADNRSEEHTSELQSLMRNSSAVFCMKTTRKTTTIRTT